MKNILILLLINLSCAFSTKAQDKLLSDFIIFDKQIYLDNNTYNQKDLTYSKSSDSGEIALSFYESSDNKDTVCIFILNTSTDNISIEKYYIENIYKSLLFNNSSYLINIGLSEKYLAVVTYGNIYLLERKTKQVISVLNNEKYHFDNLSFIEDDKIFFYSNYNFHKLDRVIKTQFSIFSIPNFKLIKDIKPKFNYIQYTHLQPNHWIGCLNNKILFSQTIDYHIDLYDKNLNLQNTILLPKNFIWISPNKKQKKHIESKTSALEAIDEVMKYENRINRIIGIHWISDNTFLVDIKHGSVDNELRTFDVWKYVNANWGLDKHNIIDKPLNNIELKNNEYSFFPVRFSRNFIFTENSAYLLTFDAPIELNKYSTEEYIKKSNEYLYENNPVFQIIKFKHILNE